MVNSNPCRILPLNYTLNTYVDDKYNSLIQSIRIESYRPDYKNYLFNWFKGKTLSDNYYYCKKICRRPVEFAMKIECFYACMNHRSKKKFYYKNR